MFSIFGRDVYRTLVVVALIVVAVAGYAVGRDGNAAAPTPTVATAPTFTPAPSAASSPLRLPSPTPGGPALYVPPTALGADASVGTVVFNAAGGPWRYDGATGLLLPFGYDTMFAPARHVAGVYPAGQAEFIDVRSMRAAFSPPDLRSPFAVDVLDDGQVAYVTMDGRQWQPRARNIAVLSWSPDERYLLLRSPSFAAGDDSFGQPLYVLDVSTLELTTLGDIIPGHLAWSWLAPHTLTFAEGRAYAAFANKTLRVWSPEDGTRTLTTANEAVSSPLWHAPTGDVLYVTGLATGVLDMAARPRDRHIERVHPGAAQPTVFAHPDGYNDVAIWISEAGDVLLVLRLRILDEALELWRIDPDGSAARALIRIPSAPWNIAESLVWGR